MHLNPDQTQLLRRVSKARDRVSKARERFAQAELDSRQAVQEALDAGVPQTRVAEAFGVTRMTLWRWQHPTNEEQR